ncbi:extracellular solute-binding protein [Erysipelothrix sp. HDW6A]|uniref:extracellular solute-binding protein n=1 Tax=Erysipelothrix sp. HDW6A TaxID=2714928 RepID=UPI00140DDD79|nr:extracellular solute-binding protein [Erysipelothrix sp. HDW6A]QIK57169.1 extracellular solute-binding protein [Erysipelothrix sp. HDW6A]
MKKLYMVLVVIAIALVFVLRQQESDTIIIYSSAEQFRNDELQSQLNKKFPELNVRVMYTPTAKAAAKLYVEGKDSDADIVLALETSYMNKIIDSLADIEGYSKADYLPGFGPETHNNKFVTWERQAASIAINPDVLAKYNLPAPTSYEDLLDPMYKNLVAMPDPKSSGTGYMFYKNVVNMLGDEAALEYFDKLAKNVKQFTESGSGPVKLLNQGEVAVGIALTFQTVKEINKGMHLEVIFSEWGSPYSLTGTGIVSGHESNPDVIRVYDFLVNDFIYYDKENFSPERIMKNQKNLIDNYPTDFDYADMTGIDSIQEKERLLSMWKF